MISIQSESAVGSLVDVLHRRAVTKPSGRLYTFLGDREDEESTLSSGQLDERARRLGATLQDLASPGERALLLYPPGLDYLAGFFGCLYAGAVAVPAYPPDPMRLERTLPRLRAIAQDSGARVVLTTSAILAVADFVFDQAPELRSLTWLATDALPAGGERAWRRPALSPDTLAFLQYTSGSTGEPKGVMLSHGNLLHNLALIAHAFQVRPDSFGVIWLPPYHDMGMIGGILEPLYSGFDVALMSPLTFLRNPFRWLEAVSRFRGTISGGPNFAFDLCARKITPEQRQRLDLSSWEVAFCGAEPIRAETLDRFVEVFAPHGFRREALYPCYGLAESTLIVTGGKKGAPPITVSLDAEALTRHRASPAEADAPAARRHVSCGRALLNQEILIVDPETLAERAPGEVGEVWVKGPSVALGYWRRPQETERTFGVRPHRGSGRYLRTGDLGALTDAGELIITGRIKDVIIVRGQNHYPQDIEHTAELSHPAIRPGCSAAFAVDDGGEEQIVVVAEVTAELSSSRDPSALEAAAAAIRIAVVSRHELHVHTVALLGPGSIPKTSSGKIQRTACRAALLSGKLDVRWRSTPDPAGDFVAPRTPTEVQLAEIWAQVLGLERVGVHDDFLALGGQSLLATQAIARIEQAMGVKLPLRALFEAPTVAAIAARIQQTRLDQGESAPEAPPLTPAPRDGVVQLSFAQQRLWFLHQLNPASAAYNIAAALELVGPLDLDALRRAFHEIVRRHEALRTTFALHDGQPCQLIQPAADFPMPVIALDHRPEERDAEVTRRAADHARQPFDLAAGPLLRAAVLRISAERHVLLVSMHHIVSDGWSMGVLVRELQALYDAFCKGEPSPLPELPIQYADYALWQRRWLTGEVLHNQLRYWHDRLADAPLLELPTDRPRPLLRTDRGQAHSFCLSAELAAAATQVGLAQGATLFMVLLAAFDLLLSRYSGQDDLCVGVPIAGRTREGLSPLIGFFVNTLVLRVSASGDLSFSELVDRVKDASLGAYAHQDVPFEQVVTALKADRDPSRSPLFQVLFALQNVPLAPPSLHGLRTSLLPVPTETAKFDLELVFMDGPSGTLEGRIEYSTDLFDPATIAQMAAHYCALLEAAVHNPGARLGQLPMLRHDERRRLLALGLGLDAGVSLDIEEPCLHSRVQELAQRSPDAVAIERDGACFTYGELDRLANRAAHWLLAQGVHACGRVALDGLTCAEALVATLALFKLGAVAAFDHDSSALLSLRSGWLSSLLPALPSSDDRPPPAHASPDGLAVLIDGIRIDHPTLARLCRALALALELSPSDRVLLGSTHPPFHDALATLVAGATLVGPQADAPSVAWLSAEDLAALPALAHASLRTVVVDSSSAAQLAPSLHSARRLHARRLPPGVYLIDGQPAGIATCLLDQQHDLAPLGVWAELCLHAGLSPDTPRAAQQFVSCSLDEGFHASLLRTGQRVRRLHDGRLQWPSPQLDASLHHPADQPFVAPRSPVEKAIAQIWCHVLQREQVGLHDNFFELGGNSLSSILMLAQTHEALGVELPLPALFEAPTVAAIAARIQQTRLDQGESAPEAPPSLLMPLRSRGERPPLFFVHAAGGSAFAYRELARRIDDDRPFYGLHAAGVDDDAPPMSDVREMAQRYIQAIRRAQAKGPYHLGGWSFGGLVAFEIAQQLVDAGEHVDFLALVDTWAPGFAPAVSIDPTIHLVQIAHELGVAVSPEDVAALPSDARLSHVAARAAEAGLLSASSAEASLERLLSVVSAHALAAWSYTPRTYDGRIALFRAESPPGPDAASQIARDPTCGWAAWVTGALDVHVVPGDHFTVVQPPHVDALAAALSRALAAAGDRSATGR